jgi:hypothetical protein
MAGTALARPGRGLAALEKPKSKIAARARKHDRKNIGL